MSDITKIDSVTINVAGGKADNIFKAMGTAPNGWSLTNVERSERGWRFTFAGTSYKVNV